MAEALAPRLGKPERREERKMKKENAITAEQIERMLNRMEKMSNKAYNEYNACEFNCGNYHDGVADGIAYALTVLGIEF